MSDFQAAKLWLVETVGLARDALHIHVALALFFGAMLVFKWRAERGRPWLLVLAVALAGEAWDVIDTLDAGRRLRPWGNWHDLWNTMIWPTALTLIAKARWLTLSGVHRRQ